MTDQQLEQEAPRASRLTSPLPRARSASEACPIFSNPGPQLEDSRAFVAAETAVEKLQLLPRMARDMLASASAKMHPFYLEEDEIASLRQRGCRQCDKQHRYLTRQRQTEQGAGQPPPRRDPPAMRFLSQAEVRSLQMTTELRLGYTALLAAHLPKSAWVSPDLTRDNTALLLAGALMLARKVTSDVPDGAPPGRNVSLWRQAWGIGNLTATTLERLSGAEYTYASARSLKPKIAMLEREMLMWLAFELTLAPEDVLASTLELHRWTRQKNQLPACEERFARRLFIEAYADLYVPGTDFLARESLPNPSMFVASHSNYRPKKIVFSALFSPAPVHFWSHQKLDWQDAPSPENFGHPLGDEAEETSIADDGDGPVAPAMTREGQVALIRQATRIEASCPSLPFGSSHVELTLRCRSLQS